MSLIVKVVITILDLFIAYLIYTLSKTSQHTVLQELLQANKLKKINETQDYFLHDEVEKHQQILSMLGEQEIALRNLIFGNLVRSTF